MNNNLFVSVGNRRLPQLLEKFNVEPYGKNISTLFLSEPLNYLKANLAGMCLIGSLQNMCLFFLLIGYPRW